MRSFESESSLVPPAASSHATRPSVIIGPLGLRAGWGLLLYFLLTAGLSAALFYGVALGTGYLRFIQTESQRAVQTARAAKISGKTPPIPITTVATATISEVAQAGGVLLAGLGLALLERRRFGVYGLPSRRLRDIVPGALWGLIAISGLIGLLWRLGALVFDQRLLQGAAALRYGLIWLSIFLLVGLFEEFLFRGYIQFTLMRGLLGLARQFSPAHERMVAFWISALCWSTVFFVTHMANAGENASGLAGVFLAGILFSYALWHTGSLWWGVGFHMTWDWGQSFLFGVPDSGTLSQGRLFETHAVGRTLISGGMDGPEGSLLLIPVFLLMFLAIRLQPKGVQPPVEPRL